MPIGPDKLSYLDFYPCNHARISDLFWFLGLKTDLRRSTKPNNTSAGADRSKPHVFPTLKGECVFGLLPLGVAGRTRGCEEGIETPLSSSPLRNRVLQLVDSTTAPVPRTTSRYSRAWTRHEIRQPDSMNTAVVGAINRLKRQVIRQVLNDGHCMLVIIRTLLERSRPVASITCTSLPL